MDGIERSASSLARGEAASSAIELSRSIDLEASEGERQLARHRCHLVSPPPDATRSRPTMLVDVASGARAIVPQRMRLWLVHHELDDRARVEVPDPSSSVVLVAHLLEDLGQRRSRAEADRQRHVLPADSRWPDPTLGLHPLVRRPARSAAAPGARPGGRARSPRGSPLPHPPQVDRQVLAQLADAHPRRSVARLAHVAHVAQSVRRRRAQASQARATGHGPVHCGRGPPRHRAARVPGRTGRGRCRARAAGVGWAGGSRDPSADGHVARGGHDAARRRDLLLPALHALQSRVGWISQPGLNYVCRRLSVPPAEAYGVAIVLRPALHLAAAADRRPRVRRPRLPGRGCGTALRRAGADGRAGRRRRPPTVRRPGCAAPASASASGRRRP